MAAALALPPAQYRAEISAILWRDLMGWPAVRSPRPHRKGEYDHGHLQLWFATDASRAGGELHRHGVAGAYHRSAGPGARARGLGPFRTGSAHRLAHASARPDVIRRLRRGPGTKLGWENARDQSGRRCLDSAKRKALARRRAGDEHGSCRHPRGARRQARHLDGARQRRAIQGAGWRLAHDPEKWQPVFGKDHAQVKTSSCVTSFITGRLSRAAV